MGKSEQTGGSVGPGHVRRVADPGWLADPLFVKARQALNHHVQRHEARGDNPGDFDLIHRRRRGDENYLLN